MHAVRALMDEEILVVSGGTVKVGTQTNEPDVVGYLRYVGATIVKSVLSIF